ncbi:hypothetical protein BDV34DRAFT_200393 [Aspergillus parasiticus]|uniref:Uncharacterized protein n=1 Tax=Aspergillus parasiticus TaxID=5067 RepID=A0A5N6DCR1_ASPPA|nr:hypothetical protein BDV34DRAFT_200393 [Aspergillus parasiticus]
MQTHCFLSLFFPPSLSTSSSPILSQVSSLFLPPIIHHPLPVSSIVSTFHRYLQKCCLSEAFARCSTSLMDWRQHSREF